MDIGNKKRFTAGKKDRYLHSANHVLADELSQKLRDPRHFGFYLKMAITHDHAFLRKLAAEVLENKNVKSPAKLFAYLIKQHHKSNLESGVREATKKQETSNK
jgi:hypothetical protein